jgi:hypothetical protein
MRRHSRLSDPLRTRGRTGRRGSGSRPDEPAAETAANQASGEEVQKAKARQKAACEVSEVSAGAVTAGIIRNVPCR